MAAQRRLIKKVFPAGEIGKLFEEADNIKHSKIYNYEYTYYIKTPNGLRLDTPICHKYGDTREGYEQWKEDHPDLLTGYSGEISARDIYTRDKPHKSVGCMFEKKLPDSGWVSDMEALFEQSWDIFISELDVKDEESMKYFLLSNIEYNFRDEGGEIISKFERIIKCIEKYNDPDEKPYHDLINKIKG